MSEFDAFSDIYDLIHEEKDYQSEVIQITKLIKDRNEKYSTLLDVCCGSGNHIKYFSNTYQCSGIDLSQNLINICIDKNIDAKKENMSNFNLNKKFDIITCLFGSIAHNLDYESLFKTIRNFKEHLAPNGIIIIEPWLFKGQFIEQIKSKKVNGVQIKSTNTIKNSIAEMRKEYCLNGKVLETTIKVNLFSKEDYLKAANENNLEIELLNIVLEEDLINGIFILNDK